MSNESETNTSAEARAADQKQVLCCQGMLPKAAQVYNPQPKARIYRLAVLPANIYRELSLG
jgi:hypothetical protein